MQKENQSYLPTLLLNTRKNVRELKLITWENCKENDFLSCVFDEEKNGDSKLCLWLSLQRERFKITNFQNQT